MTRWWSDGIAIEVELDGTGVPVHIRLPQRQAQVQWVAARWRLDERWWRQRIWRDYWQLVTVELQIVTVYHELPDGAWRLQRQLD